MWCYTHYAIIHTRQAEVPVTGRTSSLQAIFNKTKFLGNYDHVSKARNGVCIGIYAKRNELILLLNNRPLFSFNIAKWKIAVCDY
jgi:hypothetical protein